MGKWTEYKDKLEHFKQEETWQQKVDEQKKAYAKLKQKTDLAEEKKRLDEIKDGHEAAITELNIKIEALSQMLLDRLEDEDITSFKDSAGRTVYIQDDIYCTMEDRAKFFGWIKRNKMASLLSVNYQTMTSLVKGMMEEGKPVPPGIKTYYKSSVRIRKA